MSQPYVYSYVYDIDIVTGAISNESGPLAGAFLNDANLPAADEFLFGETVYVYGASGAYVENLTYYGHVGPTDNFPNYGVILAVGDPASPTYRLYTDVATYNNGDIMTIWGGPNDTTPDPFCLARGTMVDVPGGRVLVEDVRAGDVVMTVDGDEATVRWVGRQTHRPSTGDRDTRPIRIREGALAPSVPDADLVVSADHGLFVDGVLVNARALVNGTSVVFEDVAPGSSVDYFHLELDDHRMVLANGAPVESFVDNVSRRGFDNHDEWVALGLEPLPANTTPYLRAKSARQVPQRVRDRIAERLEALGLHGDAVAV